MMGGVCPITNRSKSDEGEYLLQFIPTPIKLGSPTKKYYRADFGVMNGSLRAYNAYTDGQLEDQGGSRFNLTECKRNTRTSKRIPMQETTEFVAWIKQCPDQRVSRMR